MISTPSWAALAPLIVLAVVVDVACLIDLWRRAEPAHLPRWAWTILILISFPLGAVAYLWLGRCQDAVRDPS